MMFGMFHSVLNDNKKRIPLFCFFIILTIPASSQPAVSPVLSEVSDTASFSWEIPLESLISGASFYTINPSGRVVFILISSGAFLVTDPYRKRVVFNGSYTARNISFTMDNIQTSDNGTYTCGIGGTTPAISNCGQKLIVLGKPTTPARPRANAAPVYNLPVTLTCHSTTTTVPADHGLSLTYSWQRDGKYVTPSPGSPYTFTVNTREIQNYRCMARESRGLESEWSVVYNMVPKSSPGIDTTLDPQVWYVSSLGENVTVSVRVLAYPVPTFTWNRTSSTSQNLTGSLIPVSNISASIHLHLTQSLTQDTEITRKRSSHEEQCDYHNTAFSTADSERQYDELNSCDENRQIYTELQTYVNLEPKSDQDNDVQNTAVYEKLQDSRPAPYDSLNVHNSQGHITVSPYEVVDVGEAKQRCLK